MGTAPSSQPVTSTVQASSSVISRTRASLGCLADLDLPARELPAPRGRGGRRTPRGEHPAALEDRRADDVAAVLGGHGP